VEAAVRIAAALALICGGVWLASVSPVLAQAVPIGPDFWVGGDLDLSHCPVAAIDDERWFVVAYATDFWWWPEACGLSDSGVLQGCEALDDSGINFVSQRPVDVAAIGVDDFMVVWETTFLGPPEETLVRGRRMSARAVLLTGPFDVVGGVLSYPRDPRVAALPSARVIVVWVDDSSSGTDDSGTSIQAGYFSIDGSPLGPPFQVNTTILGDQTMPDVASATDGRFVVTWESESSSGSDASGTSVQLRRFDADGLPIGSDEQVNTYANSDQRNPRVACPGDGSFVFVWDSEGSGGNDDSSLSIQGRIFGADGTPLGTDFQVNSYIDSTQDEPAVAAMADGSFEVVWSSDGSPGDDDSYRSVQGQAFDASGGMVGSQLQVNTTTYYSQWAPDIDMTPQGDLIVVWNSSANGLRGRILRQLAFADGFESGDTSAWSATLP